MGRRAPPGCGFLPATALQPWDRDPSGTLGRSTNKTSPSEW